MRSDRLPVSEPQERDETRDQDGTEQRLLRINVVRRLAEIQRLVAAELGVETVGQGQGLGVLFHQAGLPDLAGTVAAILRHPASHPRYAQVRSFRCEFVCGVAGVDHRVGIAMKRPD